MKKGVDYTGIGVVFACHDGNGKFLFAKRSANCRDGQGTWEIPAGGVEYGERIIDALARELKEELNVVSQKTEFIGYKDVVQKEEDRVLKHWVVLQFLIEVDPAEVSIGEPDMCDGIEWHVLDNAPEPLHFGVRETIEDIIAYKK